MNGMTIFKHTIVLIALAVLSACGSGSGGSGGGAISDSSDIALFANDAYVDYIPNAIGSEASNLEATLRAQGHTVMPFTGITASDISTAVTGKTVLVIPELENSTLNPDLDDAARAAIASFVNGGGTLMTFWFDDGEIDLVNAAFGFSMIAVADVAPLTRNAANAVGTPYENCGPATLASLGSTNAITAASLPAGAKVIYDDANGNAIVTLIPVGSGNIVLFGWDWWQARPTGTLDGGWWSVMYRASRLNKTLPNVAVVNATSTSAWYDDVKAKLDASCQFDSVTLVDAATTTPNLAALQTFDAILVSSDTSFSDAVALGDVVADYMDTGGGVVLSHFTFDLAGLGGRFLTDNYYAIPDNSSTDAGTQETGVFNFSNHALMAGVTSFNGGASSYQPNTSVVVTGVGATRIADWSDGTTPLVVTRAIGNSRRADLGFWPVSADGFSGGWVPTTDGDKLMANALTWTANRPEPSSTSYASADTFPMTIDGSATVTSAITVSGGPTSVSKVTVTLNITHTFNDDLDIFLQSPTGTMVELVTDIGGSGDDFTNTVFDDAAATAISAVNNQNFAPFTGSFIPEGTLADVIGEDANGQWTLQIDDNFAGFDDGTLNSWSISIR